MRAADVRFTVPEATAFLADVMRLDLRADQVATLANRTEGWAAGLQLAALTAREREAHGESVDRFVDDLAVVGSLQLVPSLRRRHLGWHRRAGRLVAAAGLLVAGSALWMTLAYSPKPGTGALLLVLRLVFGVAMLVSLVLGVLGVRRRDTPPTAAG